MFFPQGSPGLGQRIQGQIQKLPGFIFGEGTENLSYESLKKKREIADLLAQQVAGGTPQNVGEGIAAIGKALLARRMNTKLGPMEDAERQRISDLLSGGTGGGYSGNPASMPQGQPNYADAIASIESAGSGDYNAMGPVTKKGDRAYGRYQVMGSNIPDWTKRHLGTELTPEAFLASPQAQDAVFQGEFGSYIDQYGPEGAASMWFSGDPTPDGDRDQLGTSDTDYVQKFIAALGQPGGFAIGGQSQPDMSRVGGLAEILSNDYATEGQKLIAKLMIEKAFESGESIDPIALAGLNLDMQDNQLARQKFEYERQRDAAQDAKPPKTDDITEYEFYSQQARAAGQEPIPFHDWQIQNRRAGGTNVTTNVGRDEPADAAFYKDMDSADAKRFSAMLEMGPQVNRTAAQIDMLKAALANSPQGAEGRWKQMAGEFGIATEGLDDIQAAQAIINSLVPAQRPPGSGPMSDADLELYKQSLPRIMNQPGGNQMILQTMRAINEYDRTLAQVASDLAARKITREEARQKIDNLQNPLQGWGAKIKGMDEPEAKSFAGAPPVGTVVEGYRYKGGDPNDMNSWEKQ